MMQAIRTVTPEYDHARDRRALLQNLWKIQHSYCAYCGEETELEECFRLTQKLQNLMVASNPYLVCMVLVQMEWVRTLQKENLIMSLLQKIKWAVVPHYEMDRLFGDFPEVMDEYRKAGSQFFVARYNKGHVLPPNTQYDIVQQQLRAQVLLASVSRQARLDMAAIVEMFMGEWESPVLEFTARKTLCLLIDSELKLERCYNTYPRLRELVR